MTLGAVLDALGFSGERLAEWLEVEPDLVTRAAPIETSDPIAVYVPVARALEELSILEKLIRLVDDKERALRGRNLNEVVFNPRAFETVRDHAYDTLRALHELRTKAFGKVVAARSPETGEIRTWRVPQANFGFPDVGVVNRQAALAQQLVSANLGDEVTIPKGRYEVIAVAYLERFADRVGHEANFRRMDLADHRLPSVAMLEDLEQTVAVRRDELRRVLLQGGVVADVGEAEAPDVQREDAERLSAQFYIRTTKAQEALLRRPSYGLVVVLGVAGSGKTSVALGRTKVLCDRGPDDGEEEPTFFRPNTAVGFVLNEQLATYLGKACANLALFDMKIREYRDLREELIRTRSLDVGGLDRAPERPTHPIESSMRWVAALDEAMAFALADALEKAVADPPQERESARKQVAPRTPQQQKALEDKWSDLRQGISTVASWLRRERSTGGPRVEGLASRLDEPRARFAEQLEADASWTGSKNRELRQNVRNALRERIVRALRLTDAYATAVNSDVFTTTLAAAGVPKGDADAARTLALACVKDRKLSDAAVDALLVIAHAMSLGYAGRQDRDPISHLAQPAFYSQVFIDEFQDFTEVQIHLMGGQANPKRRAVTMVGDLQQQVRTARSIDVSACFPASTDDERVPVVLLENKRQTGPLGRLSQLYRERVLGDVPSEAPEFPEDGPRPRFLQVTADEVAAAVEDEIVNLPRGASVAVICGTRQVAERLERELRDSLTGQFRETRFSEHNDLTRRFFVHFTTALDAKGLEFDAAIVPLVERAPDVTALNAVYVALSRPRRHLTIVAASSAVEPFEGWARDGLLETPGSAT